MGSDMGLSIKRVHGNTETRLQTPVRETNPLFPPALSPSFRILFFEYLLQRLASMYHSLKRLAFLLGVWASVQDNKNTRVR